ncbi:DUF4255 domain-containing protein [Hymenobacter bucti]|uniref:DUF4255 domain-containing protein n=1 Tax=Hymenobacter bucti TaxID=1844114 RepID=A0ABW4QT61_9BACT
MIYKALSFLTNELNDYFNTVYQPLEPKAVLSAHVNADGSAATDLLNKVSLTLINLEPEATMRNLPAERGSSSSELRLNPPLRLSLRVLVAANFSEYQDALRFLSSTLAFFQGHSVFTPQNAPRLDKDIERLVVELETTSYQEWSYLWGMLGTKYMPGAVYKLKLISIQDGVGQPSARPILIPGLTTTSTRP